MSYKKISFMGGLLLFIAMGAHGLLRTENVGDGLLSVSELKLQDTTNIIELALTNRPLGWTPNLQLVNHGYQTAAAIMSINSFPQALSMDPSLITPELENTAKTILQNSWEVDSKVTLQARLGTRITGGYRKRFGNIIQKIATIPQLQQPLTAFAKAEHLDTYINSGIISADEALDLWILGNFGFMYSKAAVTMTELSRLSSLITWGYFAKYLDQNEAFAALEDIALVLSILGWDYLHVANGQVVLMIYMYCQDANFFGLIRDRTLVLRNLLGQGAWTPEQSNQMLRLGTGMLQQNVRKVPTWAQTVLDDARTRPTTPLAPELLRLWSYDKSSIDRYFNHFYDDYQLYQALTTKNIPLVTSLLTLIETKTMFVHDVPFEGRKTWISLCYELVPEVLPRLISLGFRLDNPSTKNQSVLARAIDDDKFELYQTLVTAGADINEQNYNGQTALWQAIESKNLSVIADLLARKADVTLDTSGDSASLALLALDRLDVPTLELLARHGLSFATSRTKGLELYNRAINQRQKDKVQFLLQQGVSYTNDPVTELGVFQKALLVDEFEIAEILLNAGAPLENFPGARSDSEAILASRGPATLFKTFLAKKTSPSLYNLTYNQKKFVSILHLATLHPDPSMVSILMDLGINTNLVDESGLPFLHYYLSNKTRGKTPEELQNSLPLLDGLQNWDQSILGLVDTRGNTILNYLAQFAKAEVIETFLRKFPAKSLKDPDIAMAVQQLYGRNLWHLLDSLVPKMQNIQASYLAADNKSIYTILGLAFYYKDLDRFEQFLQLGASPDIPRIGNRNLLQEAVAQNHRPYVTLLLHHGASITNVYPENPNWGVPELLCRYGSPEVLEEYFKVYPAYLPQPSRVLDYYILAGLNEHDTVVDILLKQGIPSPQPAEGASDFVDYYFANQRRLHESSSSIPWEAKSGDWSINFAPKIIHYLNVYQALYGHPKPDIWAILYGLIATGTEEQILALLNMHADGGLFAKYPYQVNNFIDWLAKTTRNKQRVLQVLAQKLTNPIDPEFALHLFTTFVEFSDLASMEFLYNKGLSLDNIGNYQDIIEHILERSQNTEILNWLQKKGVL